MKCFNENRLTWKNNFKEKLSDLWFDLTWKPNEFIKNWIYPAYYLKNLLFYRYDIVRLHKIKRYEYSDSTYRMLLANMSLINDFIEKEQPEKYVCWYKDENGEDVGHHYGECEKHKMYLPEYKDKYIMDIIKEIYHWWNVDYIQDCKEYDYILDFWSDYLAGDWSSKKEDDLEYYSLDFDKSNCPKTIEDLNKIENVNWEILDKYFTKEQILEEDFVHNYLNDFKIKIEEDEQKYLHLCIEVRKYLWT